MKTLEKISAQKTRICGDENCACLYDVDKRIDELNNRLKKIGKNIKTFNPEYIKSEKDKPQNYCSDSCWLWNLCGKDSNDFFY